jgi:hypothetical protein
VRVLINASLRVLMFTLVPWLSSAAPAHAEPEGSASEAGAKAEGARAAESASRFSLGIAGFGGGLFSEEERGGGGGGSLAAAFAIVPERWEIELGLSLVKLRHGDPLGVFEVVAKHLLERRGAWAPHVSLGPVFSLDFGRDVKSSGGLLLGTGVIYWFNARFGATGECAYRLLLSSGPEAEHVLTLALGARMRF